MPDLASNLDMFGYSLHSDSWLALILSSVREEYIFRCIMLCYISWSPLGGNLRQDQLVLDSRSMIYLWNEKAHEKSCTPREE